MGSVYQRAGRKGWYINYLDARGRSVNRKVTAATKSEARRFLAELERKIERQRMGLEALPDDREMTLGQLVEWWLKERCGETSRPIERSRCRLQRSAADPR